MTAGFVVPSLVLAAAALTGLHAHFTRTPQRKDTKR